MYLLLFVKYKTQIRQINKSNIIYLLSILREVNGGQFFSNTNKSKRVLVTVITILRKHDGMLVCVPVHSSPHPRNTLIS